MAGLIGALLLGTLGISAAKKASDNAYFMSKPAGEFKDGTSYYMDGELNTYANGEKVIKKVVRNSAGDIKLIEVGKKSGKVYRDVEQERIDRSNNHNLEQAKKMGKLVYIKTDQRFKYISGDTRVTCEISTGRYIANIRRNSNGTKCSKTYLVDNVTLENYNSNLWGEIGETVEITEEEFDGLNILGYTPHMVYDFKKIRY